MSDKDAVHRYTGERVDVTWDERLCIHFGACVASDGEVFVKGRRPWVVPDAAGPDEVAAIVARCPSGALVAEPRDGATPQPAAANVIEVQADGPLHAQGDLDVVGAPADMPGVARRAALCRCGLSKLKPFCDNSHRDAGFADPGAVADTGTPLEDEGGAVEIRPMPNGPLKLAGNVTVVGADGTRWQGAKAALCRCGHSQNKPFCDGAHKAAGFEAPGG